MTALNRRSGHEAQSHGRTLAHPHPGPQHIPSAAPSGCRPHTRPRPQRPLRPQVPQPSRGCCPHSHPCSTRSDQFSTRQPESLCTCGQTLSLPWLNPQTASQTAPSGPPPTASSHITRGSGCSSPLCPVCPACLECSFPRHPCVYSTHPSLPRCHCIRGVT